MTAYSEATMCNALARHTFRDALCVVDNCYWPGSECDLLVVKDSLRVIDVEVKISRADLKADRGKDKWIGGGSYDYANRVVTPHVPIKWPRRVWKHFYAVAKPVWTPDLIEHCGLCSGILVVELLDNGGYRSIDLIRRARANPNYDALTPAQVCDIARLASLRMWDARLATHRQNHKEVA